MYRQILLDPDQTRCQRLVFRKDSCSGVQDFELKTVAFGVNCASYLAIKTLLQFADDCEPKWPLASRILREMMNVDDALVGAVSRVLEARNQLRLALSSAGFSMRKWTSNDREASEGLPPDHLLRILVPLKLWVGGGMLSRIIGTIVSLQI